MRQQAGLGTPSDQASGPMEHSLSDNLAKILRIITLPPFMALLMTTLLFIYNADAFGGWMQYIATTMFLFVMPLLTFPLQKVLPMFQGDVREQQRRLSLITSAIGYISGAFFAIMTNALRTIQIIYGSYVLSVALLFLINKRTKWRASGHACGAGGPIAVMIYVLGPVALPTSLLFAGLCWASLKMRRHTPMELVLGGLDSVLAVAVITLIL